MTEVGKEIQIMFGNFFNSLSAVVQAVILLLLAWIAASIVRAVVKKLITGLMKKKDTKGVINQDTSKSTIDLIGNLVYAIVFCLFLPGALDKLGMTSVSGPIMSMVSTFLNYLPNIIAAVIVVAFGAFLAKLVMQIVASVLKKTQLDSLQEKCGIEKGEDNGFSDIIAKIVYAFIIVIFVIAAIQILNISAISEPAVAMVAQIFDIIPKIFAAAILIAFGAFLAKLLDKLVRSFLAGTGLDKFCEEFIPVSEGKEPVKVSEIIAMVVRIIIDIIFIVSGVKVLGIEVLSNIGSAVIGYLPAILSAIIIFAIAWIIADKVGKLIIKNNEKATGLAMAAKSGIIILATFMALSQLGVASGIINTLFFVAVASVGIAFAIAFGNGGKEWAKDKLDEISKNTEDQIKK